MRSVPSSKTARQLPVEGPAIDVIDALPVATAVLSSSGIIQRTNHAFRGCTGDFANAGDRHCADLVHPDDRSSFSASLISALSERHGSPAVEVRLTSGDGDWTWMLATAAAAPQSGPLPQIIVQFADISGLRRREARLAASESRWNQALVSSTSGVWDHNIATGEMFYSDTWRALRGYAPDDKIATDTEEWLLKLHPDDRERVRQAIERQNAADPEYEMFEYRELHKDGHWVWIECRGSCVEWDRHGNPARIIGIDIDITQRKEAQEMLAHVSRRLELALETSNIGIFEADLETRAVHWDEHVISMYGLNGPAREFPDGTWQSFLHPEDLSRAVANTAEAISNGQALTNQFRIFRKNDGAMRYLRSRATSFTDQNGRRKLIGATWDVTDDVSLHQQLDHARTLAEARNDELEDAKARIEHIALHDYLTGLPNRRFLDDMLSRLAAECEQSGEELAILHIDLDRFKQINDTLGHSAGDMMLRHAANILKDNVRDQDFVARIGGDEFVFLAKFHGSQRKLGRLAHRIIEEMRKPVVFEGHDCRFGSSIGIATADGPKIDARQLLLNADIALYNAKNRGRNRYEFFSRDSHSQMINTKRLSDQILCGLEQDQFVPFYQFQFDARTLDVAGVETLARWNHPERGILTPDNFLAVAEDLNVVAEIDGRILEKALADFKRWGERGLDVPKLSVNVSSRRLHDHALRQKLAGLSIEPGKLSFELLESIFLDEYDEQVQENLEYLRQAGIEIEVDDFGTGHASIVSLLRLKPHTLKIDRELVHKIHQSKAQRQLIGSIIEIGHSLNVRVVAEGVETPDHVRILRKLRCDVLQGYGLSLPMAFEETENFLHQQNWRHPAQAAAGFGKGRRR